MPEATGTCPFSQKEGWLRTTKDMEKRWGLTLVSFLPTAAQDRVKSLQAAVSDFPCLGRPPADPDVEFYEPGHLHCTHMTLRRSNAWGPVRAEDLVKPSHGLFELFEVIHENSCRMEPMNVTLDRLGMARDGLSLVLTGKCSDDGSARDRRMLLRSLNAGLDPRFHISPRTWDRDEAAFHKVHCRMAFLKRPLETYPAFLESLKGLAERLHPISLTFETIVLVHHRYRSLRPPHEGEVAFPLGQDIRAGVTDAVFASKVNLAR